MSNYDKMEDVYEPVVDAIKAELEATGLFDEVDEGENIYEGSGRKAMVIGGPDNIRSVGSAVLEHQILIYVIILDSDEGTTPSKLRQDMAPAYDTLMEDVKHGGTCWVCLPTLWSPGFLQWGDRTYVGILSQWMARVHQVYNPAGA